MIAGFRCAVCGLSVDIAEACSWRCANATFDDRHHVLHLVVGGAEADVIDDQNPFVRYGPRLAWWAFARANGMTALACEALTREVAAEFQITPFGRSQYLSDELGVPVAVKDETRDVAGSHKARHLVTTLLHLRAAELMGMLTTRPRLAIASCGNAALAAATLAARVEWPIDVFVPTWMDDSFGVELDRLPASVHRCERRSDDPPGDPAMLRFRQAVADGAIPFTVQGPENAYCLDGGRTLGWEIADQAAEAGVQIGRVVVQVGGGALAACVGAGLGRGVRLDTVQAEGCAPLADTWNKIAGIDHPERYWSEVMKPWPNPHSVADGILDDETYDWIAVVEAMVESGGQPIVADESQIVGAHRLATAAGFTASPTGSAGLAGVLASLPDDDSGDDGGDDDADSDSGDVVVIMSGVARSIS